MYEKRFRCGVEGGIVLARDVHHARRTGARRDLRNRVLEQLGAQERREGAIGFLGCGGSISIIIVRFSILRRPTPALLGQR